MVLDPALEIDFLEFHTKSLLNFKKILEFIIKMLDGGVGFENASFWASWNSEISEFFKLFWIIGDSWETFQKLLDRQKSITNFNKNRPFDIKK